MNATTTTHRYDADTDRCTCGGEITYFEYREDVAHYRRTGEHRVIAYDGYGCSVEGRAHHECCESTSRLGHSRDCDLQAAMDHAVVTDVYRTEFDGPLNPCTCNFGAYSVLLDDVPDDVNPHGPECPLADDDTRKV